MAIRRSRFILFILIAALAFGACLTVLWLRPQNGGGSLSPGQSGTPPKEDRSAEDFGIQTVHSPVDFNGNGTDDYTDFLLGARKDAQDKPKYDNSYYRGGYPPDGSGACTDLVWRAFRNAGYCLKDMVDRDIAEHTPAYPVDGKPDPNIDFRRTAVLKIYFERHAVSLTTDPKQIAEWQPGDIVTFGTHHIGIISDRRDKSGIPYLLHNAGQPEREEDALTRCGEISGHFRFDASRLKKSELIPFGSPK
ncbi:DUF1287 domain-containing protein [Caproicibacter fermentans]|uniref:DUF1287 domain-containing protein n=1 Tax=Caproicibacter fermentans TaxID=2576756 RepID=A0A7G8T7W6_9FIRM|nr:DUF1287 domain-containing protein [Caproicibacter fermentans]QNK39707.1 DUF1287 domain-containing protein [Caproicibacter fermentans]